MRIIEGEQIAEDLNHRIDEIEQKVKKISLLSTGLIDEYVVKLNTRIKELLKDQEIDEARLAQEVGSKANNLEITNEVINIKTQLENIREQVQNIE